MKKEYDLKSLRKRPGAVKVDKQATKVAISLRLEGSDLPVVKNEAQRLGIPYQTLIGSIIHQYATGELVETKTVKLLKELKSA